MRVYLAGPMSGYDDFNRPAFSEAARILRDADPELGVLTTLPDGRDVHALDVVSPAELDTPEELDGLDPHAIDEDSWRYFLARDVMVVASPEIEAVVVLPGWEESKGAALEVHVARTLGKPILAYPSLEPVKEPTKYRPPTEESVAEEAQRLVHGDRGAEYGHPADDFDRSARIMSVILGHPVEARQVPLLMIAVKLSRLVESPDKRDSVTDLVGYALTLEMTMEREGRPLR